MSIWDGFDFGRREWLWLLALLPALMLRIGRGQSHRRSRWRALGRSDRPPGDGSWWWLGGIAVGIVALAGPRWGRASGPPPTPGHDVALLVDVSRSMAAEDAVPNRLGVAVRAAEGLLGALGREPGGRAAVIAFAGRGVARCPLTENLGAAAEALRRLRPGEVRPGGTDLGSALDAAIEAFDVPGEPEPTAGRTVVVFSDGEDHPGSWRRGLPKLRAARVLVHTVAIGDPGRGHEVPTPAGPLKYQGRVVLSRRADEPLEALARETGGAFVPLGLQAADLGQLYRERIAPVARRRRAALDAPERPERYAVFAVAALTLGLIGTWPRPRRLPVLVALLALVAIGAGPSTAAEAVANGNARYRSGDFRGALQAFERAITLDPRAAIARYDAAATLYRLGRYAEAAGRYREARDRADDRLQIKIDFALGNTAVARGEYAAALPHYDACLATRAPGAALDAVRRDARINRRFAAVRVPPPPTVPEGSGDRPASRRPPPRADAAPKPGAEPPSAPNPPEADAAGSSDQPPVGSLRVGGAGGSGANAPRPDTPAARLDDALRNVRDARSRRLDEAPPAAPDEAGKDW